jgi:hypothetical protein
MGTRNQERGTDQQSRSDNRRDFGEMPDLDDLLMLAEIDESDVIEAEAWLEDVAPGYGGA